MVERRTGNADGLGGHAQSAAIQPLHRVAKPHPFLADQTIRPQSHVVKHNLCGARTAESHLIFRFGSLHPISVRRNDEERQPARWLLRLFRCAHQNQQHVRDTTIRYPCLGAVDHPGRFRSGGRRRNTREVRSAIWLRHAKCGEQLPTSHRFEPALVLLRRAIALQNVRRERIVDAQRDRDARVCRGNLLHHHEIGERIQPQSAKILGYQQSEKTQLAQPADDLPRKFLSPIPLGRVRCDLFLRKFARELDELLALLIQRIGYHVNHSHKIHVRSFFPTDRHQPSCGGADTDGTCPRRAPRAVLP